MWWKLTNAWSNFWYRFPLTRKWGSILYIHKYYGWTYRETIDMWAQAEREFDPGHKNFLDDEEDVTAKFFSLNAAMQYEKAEKYTCVFGCCSVLWLNGQYIGGCGLAGCPCDDMKDPRDLTTKED